MSKDTPGYNIVISEETVDRVHTYQQQLMRGNAKPGKYLADQIRASGKLLEDLKSEEFLDLIVNTKKPVIAAEGQVMGNGRDWNQEELSILGDVNITVDVRIYDNGVWPGNKMNPTGTYPDQYKQHIPPIEGTLLFTPGAMLKEIDPQTGIKGDRNELLNEKGEVSQEKYNAFVERKMLPILMQANQQAGADGKPAIVTMPTVGGGEFAGDNRGKMATHLDKAMQAMLEKHAVKMPNIKAIHFDSYNESHDHDVNYGNLKYKVRKSALSNEEIKGVSSKIGSAKQKMTAKLKSIASNKKRTQMSSPEDLQEAGEDFGHCKLYKVVAWDHVSFPGNDFLAGLKNTDDGIAGGGTDALRVIMKKEGIYNVDKGTYDPPDGYSTWEKYATDNGVKIEARGNVRVLGKDGEMRALEQHVEERGQKSLKSGWSKTSPSAAKSEEQDKEQSKEQKTVINFDAEDMPLRWQKGTKKIEAPKPKLAPVKATPVKQSQSKAQNGMKSALAAFKKSDIGKKIASLRKSKSSPAVKISAPVTKDRGGKGRS